MKKLIIPLSRGIGTCDAFLRKALPEAPNVIFRKAPPIGDSLVKSYNDPIDLNVLVAAFILEEQSAILRKDWQSTTML